MNYKFIGKESVISDALKEKTVQKLSRIEKFLPDDSTITARYRVEKQDNTVEITIPIQKRVLRAEVVDNDMYAAIDKIVDVLEKQLIKYKSRLRDKSRKEPSYKDEFLNLNVDENVLTNDNLVIEKTKKFAIKPMDPEEAIMEMELLGHNFYVFLNFKDDLVNVIYKRKDGSYGLIEPEF